MEEKKFEQIYEHEFDNNKTTPQVNETTLPPKPLNIAAVCPYCG